MKKMRKIISLVLIAVFILSMSGISVYAAAAKSIAADLKYNPGMLSDKNAAHKIRRTNRMFACCISLFKILFLNILP